MLRPGGAGGDHRARVLPRTHLLGLVHRVSRGPRQACASTPEVELEAKLARAGLEPAATDHAHWAALAVLVAQVRGRRPQRRPPAGLGVPQAAGLGHHETPKRTTRTRRTRAESGDQEEPRRLRGSSRADRRRDAGPPASSSANTATSSRPSRGRTGTWTRGITSSARWRSASAGSSIRHCASTRPRQCSGCAIPSGLTVLAGQVPGGRLWEPVALITDGAAEAAPPPRTSPSVIWHEYLVIGGPGVRADDVVARVQTRRGLDLLELSGAARRIRWESGRGRGTGHVRAAVRLRQHLQEPSVRGRPRQAGGRTPDRTGEQAADRLGYLVARVSRGVRRQVAFRDGLVLPGARRPGITARRRAARRTSWDSFVVPGRVPARERRAVGDRRRDVRAGAWRLERAGCSDAAVDMFATVAAQRQSRTARTRDQVAVREPRSRFRAEEPSWTAAAVVASGAATH